MKKFPLSIWKYNRNYKSYSFLSNYLRLSETERYIVRDAIKNKKIRFYVEVPHTGEIEHKFLHEGDVRKIIDTYRKNRKNNKLVGKENFISNVVNRFCSRWNKEKMRIEVEKEVKRIITDNNFKIIDSQSYSTIYDILKRKFYVW